MKKTLAVLLSFVFMLALVSCAPAAGPEPETPRETFSLFDADGTDYQIVRPDKCTLALRDAVGELASAFREITGVRVTQTSDWTASRQYPEAEILIGRTNRPESVALYETLAYDEYAVAVVGKKLLIAGGCDAATASAVRFFIANGMADGFTYEADEGELYRAKANVGEMIFHLRKETVAEAVTPYEGVTRTHYSLDENSAFGLQDFHLIDFDPNDPSLRFTVTCYDEDDITVLSPVSETVKRFGEDNPDLTVIEAVNGDLWMNYAHARRLGSGDRYGDYTDPVVTSAFNVLRSFNVYDGEIVSSPHIKQEIPYEDDFYSFGLSEDGKFYLGKPQLTVRVRFGETAFTADGLNRLPADNALICYSDRVGATHALSDACEIVLQCGDYTVRHGASVTGTVVKIKPAGTEEDVVVENGTVVLTARGDKTALLAGISEGDSVTVSFAVTDEMGNSEAWQSMRCADGGHIPVIIDGVSQNSTNDTRIPTTMLGLRSNGHVVIMINDGYKPNADVSEGFMISQLDELCRELDIVTAFISDGGGSTTLVERAANGTYSVLNRPSDGHERSVAGTVILAAVNK